MNPTNIVKLRPSGEKRSEKGHLWIFSNEIAAIDKAISPGEICGVVSSSGRHIGTGFFNPASLISVRLLKTGSLDIEEDFAETRIKKAAEYRKSVGVTDCGRFFFGESDGIPGLVIDRYNDIFVMEMLSAGAEKLKERIIKTVVELFHPAGILLKNTHHFRTLEGLPLYEETALGKIPDSVVISENGLKLETPVAGGQKTGYFFDQRENRAALLPYFKDRKVFDLYTYTGSFALMAAKGGAKAVWGIDSSQTAVDFARKNAELNGFGKKVIFEKEDAERTLNAMQNGELPERPDFILLDPPNLAGSRKHLNQAAKLYIKLHAKAMASLPEGGLLASSCCSHHVSREIFMDIISEALGKAGKKGFLLELRGQAADHPILINMPETEYLHFALIKIV